MRLKKAKRIETQEQVLRLLQTEHITSAEQAELDYYKLLLAHDYMGKLLLDLRHVGDIPLLDRLKRDTIDNSSVFDTAWMLESYPDLNIVADYLKSAEDACKYLRMLIDKEIQRRHKEKLRLFTVIK